MEVTEVEAGLGQEAFQETWPVLYPPQPGLPHLTFSLRPVASAVMIPTMIAAPAPTEAATIVTHQGLGVDEAAAAATIVFTIRS